LRVARLVVTRRSGGVSGRSRRLVRCCRWRFGARRCGLRLVRFRGFRLRRFRLLRLALGRLRLCFGLWFGLGLLAVGRTRLVLAGLLRRLLFRRLLGRRALLAALRFRQLLGVRRCVGRATIDFGPRRLLAALSLTRGLGATLGRCRTAFLRTFLRSFLYTFLGALGLTALLFGLLLRVLLALLRLRDVIGGATAAQKVSAQRRSHIGGGGIMLTQESGQRDRRHRL